MSRYRPPVLSWRSMPLMPVALMLAVGILLSSVLSAQWVLLALGAVAVVLFIFRWGRPSLWVVALVAGLATGHRASTPVPGELHYGDVRTFQGTIVEAEEHDNADNYIVEIRSPRCRLRLSVLDGHGYLLTPGSTVRFTAAVEDGSADYLLPDELDYGKLLRQRGISGCAIVRADSLQLLGDAPGIINFARRLKARVVDDIVTGPFDSGTAGFLAATLVGDDSFVDSSTRDYFSKAGIAHILALSGTHVTVIMLILMVVFFPVHASGKINLRRLLIIIFLWAYALLTGFSPSVTRAVVMASIFLTAQMIERNSSPLNSVAAAAVIILLFDPGSLYALSFQLSFLAVISIIICGAKARGLFFVEFPVVTLAATVATAPLVAYHFHIMPTLFLVSNLVAFIVLPLFLVIGVIVMVLWSVHLCAGWLVKAGDFLHHVLVETSVKVVDSTAAVVTHLYPSLPAVCIACVAILLMLIAIGRQRFRLTTAIASLVVFLSVPMANHYTTPSTPASDWMIVGTPAGNALVLVDHGKCLMVTDAMPGGKQNVRLRLQRRLEDYLGRRGIDSIEMFHPHSNVKRLRAMSTTFGFVNDRVEVSPADSTPIDFLIVGAPFHGDLMQLIARHRPGKVVFGANLHYKTLQRLDSLDCSAFDLRKGFIRRREQQPALQPESPPEPERESRPEVQ